MIRSIVRTPCSAPITVDASDLHRSQSSRVRFACTIRCSSRSYASIPKLGQFSRSMTMLERLLSDLPLIEKTKKELRDYCTTLEGDDCCSCWKAYAELNDLEQELPKEEVEKLIRGTDGVKSLIGFVHWFAQMYHSRLKDNDFRAAEKPSNTKIEEERFIHIPDGLPKSAEELEEEERARMPDSPFTRLLRAKAKRIYTPRPDHETD